MLFGHTGTELTLHTVISHAAFPAVKTAKKWERDSFTFDARFRQLQGKSD
jgi:hypothetical protein